VFKRIWKKTIHVYVNKQWKLVYMTVDKEWQIFEMV